MPSKICNHNPTCQEAPTLADMGDDGSDFGDDDHGVAPIEQGDVDSVMVAFARKAGRATSSAQEGEPPTSAHSQRGQAKALPAPDISEPAPTLAGQVGSAPGSSGSARPPVLDGLAASASGLIQPPVTERGSHEP